MKFFSIDLQVLDIFYAQWEKPLRFNFQIFTPIEMFIISTKLFEKRTKNFVANEDKAKNSYIDLGDYIEASRKENTISKNFKSYL